MAPWAKGNGLDDDPRSKLLTIWINFIKYISCDSTNTDYEKSQIYYGWIVSNAINPALMVYFDASWGQMLAEKN